MNNSSEKPAQQNKAPQEAEPQDKAPQADELSPSREVQKQANNPLHGITLQSIVEELHAELGWEGLAAQVKVRCFTFDPSIKSSLKFLRRTEWARKEVEQLYLKQLRRRSRNSAP